MRSSPVILSNFVLLLLIASSGAHEPQTTKPDRSPTRVGSVLVFAGTGWYRHPETAAVSGWLARLTDETRPRPF